MNKKYLILKRPAIKAQIGLATTDINSWANTSLNSPFKMKKPLWLQNSNNMLNNNPAVDKDLNLGSASANDIVNSTGSLTGGIDITGTTTPWMGNKINGGFKLGAEKGLVNKPSTVPPTTIQSNADTIDTSVTKTAANDITKSDAITKAGDAAKIAADEKSAKTAGIVGAAAGAGNMISNFAFENAIDTATDGFGNTIADKKTANLATGKSAVSGALKGAAAGASIGSVIPVWGTAVGAIVGGLAGGIGGLIKGKKKGEVDKAAYRDQLIASTAGAGRAQDMRNSSMLPRASTGKEGIKLEKKDIGTFKVPKKKSSSLVLRDGGKLETPGEVNVVVKGKLHKENNNLGNKDKGIPVIDADGVKEYEVEAGEIILRQDTTLLIEDYANKYDETGDEDLFEELGKILTKELLKNTQDNHGEFGVKIKEDAN